MAIKSYDPQVKTAFLTATREARSSGKSWEEAFKLAKDAGYTGTLGGLSAMIRKEDGAAGKKRRGPGRPPKSASQGGGGGSKKAAKKAGRRASAKGDFILSQPNDIPASEVVRRAAAQGLKLSDAYVYLVRNGKRGGAKRGRPAAAARPAASAPATASRGPGRPAGRPAGRSNAGPETSFRELLLQIGVDRARELLQAAEARLREFIERG